MGHQVTMWSELLIMTWVFQDLKLSMHSIIISDLGETVIKQAQKPQVKSHRPHAYYLQFLSTHTYGS